jgi:hypothetical protein
MQKWDRYHDFLAATQARENEDANFRLAILSVPVSKNI